MSASSQNPGTQRIVVVGTGQCGATASMTLRELDRSSEIVLVGEEPLRPYERPPLSKNVLLQACQPTWVFEPERYETEGIELRLGERAIGVDASEKVLKTQRGELPFSSLILATGGQPRLPPTLNIAKGALVTLRSWGDACALRDRLTRARHVTVLGGGFIGMEVAAVCRKRNLQVTVVEAATAPLTRVLPYCVADALTQLHIENGVCILVQSVLSRVSAVDDRWRVVLQNGDEWLTDVVIAGVGLVPNVDLAVTAGCDTSDGVLVNECGATSRPGIFGAGDCARFWHPRYERHLRWETWQHAIRHGVHVARCVLGATSPYMEVARGWTDQYGVSVQFAGNPTDGSTIFSRPTESGGRLHLTVRDGCIVGAVAWNAPREFRGAVALIGGHVTPHEMAGARWREHATESL
jgi:3-phenylpropionate/trans-cinnamate dioxygenase ferredoxin reductase subunit